jgi:hypothetical protein
MLRMECRSSHRPVVSASIEPGVYEIKNDVLGTTVDFNEVDRKSVVGYQYHGKGNQQVSSKSWQTGTNLGWLNNNDHSGNLRLWERAGPSKTSPAACT